MTEEEDGFFDELGWCGGVCVRRIELGVWRWGWGWGCGIRGGGEGGRGQDRVGWDVVEVGVGDVDGGGIFV